MANIVYAFILCKLKRGYLIALAIISAGILCYVSYRAGNLSGGWSSANFWDGGARIFYSFTAGLIIYRFNLIIKNRLGFIGMAMLLAGALLMPYSNNWNMLTEPLVVLLYFPLLIALGAGAALTKGFQKLCNFFGKISYPLYMTHYAVIWIFMNYYIGHKPATGQLALIIITSLILLVGFAYLVMVFYDIPVRRYLTNKRQRDLAK